MEVRHSICHQGLVYSRLGWSSPLQRWNSVQLVSFLTVAVAFPGGSTVPHQIRTPPMSSPVTVPNIIRDLIFGHADIHDNFVPLRLCISPGL